MESHRNPKGKEQNRKEKKGNEKKGNEPNAEEVNSGFPEGDSAATAIDSELIFMNGKLGKGVVLLSQEQIEERLNKRGLDSFDYYVEKLASFIQDKDSKVKNHYATILKWWEQDRRLDL